MEPFKRIMQETPSAWTNPTFQAAGQKIQRLAKEALCGRLDKDDAAENLQLLLDHDIDVYRCVLESLPSKRYVFELFYKSDIKRTKPFFQMYTLAGVTLPLPINVTDLDGKVLEPFDELPDTVLWNGVSTTTLQ